LNVRTPVTPPETRGTGFLGWLSGAPVAETRSRRRAHADRVVVRVTQGGLDNSYVPLAEHLGFFPRASVGASNARDGEGAPLTLHVAGLAEPVQTDITERHKNFRRRAFWQTFFERHHLVEGDSIVIERRSAYEYHIAPLAKPSAPHAPREWSAAEVRATVSDYLEMLEAETGDQRYSKAEHRRKLQAKLSPGRTEAAIEFKHANISAAMTELGLPYIRGYKPRSNYQAELVSEIVRRVEGGQLPTALRAAPVPKPRRGLKQTPVPPGLSHKPGGRHIDYGRLQEENRKLGRLGEHLVVQFEVEQLRNCGHADLADRVQWAAKDLGDGLGYDVLSFDVAGNERYIEVKTTALGAQTPFYVSSAELEFARSHPKSFALYRVYDVRSNPLFYALEGDITPMIDLVPTVYRAQPKGGRKPE
jgi:Protein NO VEIN, C-terminal